MSGSPRDLAVVDPWNASLERSRARRARAGEPRRAHAAPMRAVASPLGAARRARRSREARDLRRRRSRGSSRSAARARAGAPPSCSFVPASSRAKRISLGALAALTVGPTASVADSGQPRLELRRHRPRTADHDRTRHRAQLRKRRPPGAAAAARPRRHQSRRRLRPGNRRSRAPVPGQQGPDRRRRRRPATNAALRSRATTSAILVSFSGTCPAKPPAPEHPPTGTTPGTEAASASSAGGAEADRSPRTGAVKRLQGALHLPVTANSARKRWRRSSACRLARACRSTASSARRRGT